MKEWGWSIHTIQHSRWSKDIFNLFDGFVVKEGKILFFQIKTNKKPRKESYVKWVSKYGIPVILATYFDRRGWVFGLIEPKSLNIS